MADSSLYFKMLVGQGRDIQIQSLSGGVLSLTLGIVWDAMEGGYIAQVHIQLKNNTRGA